MTVAELIERLKQLPPDMPVFQSCGDTSEVEPLTELQLEQVGPHKFLASPALQVYFRGPGAFEALVF